MRTLDAFVQWKTHASGSSNAAASVAQNMHLLASLQTKIGNAELGEFASEAHYILLLPNFEVNLD